MLALSDTQLMQRLLTYKERFAAELLQADKEVQQG
jgi:hypothetical protein